jgi:hypothetical protein
MGDVARIRAKDIAFGHGTTESHYAGRIHVREHVPPDLLLRARDELENHH